MAKNNMDQDILKVLFSEQEIHDRIQEMGDQLYDKFHDRNPLFVGVLNGCFLFMADLVRATQCKSEVEFIGLSSYQNATKSSGVVRILKDLDTDVTDRHILIVEDVIDSGLTLSWLQANLLGRGAASVKIATALRKPEAAKVDVDVAYVGFDIPDEFVVGFGLDYDERYRNLDSIAVLKPKVYQGEQA